MGSVTPIAAKQPDATKRSKDNAQEVVQNLSANELVFAVVGPAGCGTSEIADALKELLLNKRYAVETILARDIIERWAAAHGIVIPPKDAPIKRATALQNVGDQMRLEACGGKGDAAAIALRMVREIRGVRANAIQTQSDATEIRPVEPDGGKRAYILDSLRNPAEAALLRSVYQGAFCLIGVVCRSESREARLREKYHDASKDELDKFRNRDEKSDSEFGQQVSDTFHLSDFFVDNSTSRVSDTPGGRKSPNKAWDAPDQLARLVDLLTHSRIIRPRAAEVGMFHAWGAAMRSSCLSRQVGAALMDTEGNLIATGTNEVPRAGGGLYGACVAHGFNSDPDPDHDFRCCVHKGCSNVGEQIEIINDMLNSVQEFKSYPRDKKSISRIQDTRIGQLIEFSRAVHAEMDALFTAVRQGISPVGARLFVTTFPCHSCARHIVVAGVDEVQFIEPYLKSRALELHDDAITMDPKDWEPPHRYYQKMLLEKKNSHEKSRESVKLARVLFQPFTGVAPRLFERVFEKDRRYKDKYSGELLREFGEPNGGMSRAPLRVSYAEVEAKLVKELEDDGP